MIFEYATEKGAFWVKGAENFKDFHGEILKYLKHRPYGILEKDRKWKMANNHFFHEIKTFAFWKMLKHG